MCWLRGVVWTSREGVFYEQKTKADDGIEKSKELLIPGPAFRASVDFEMKIERNNTIDICTSTIPDTSRNYLVHDDRSTHLLTKLLTVNK